MYIKKLIQSQYKTKGRLASFLARRPDTSDEGLPARHAIERIIGLVPDHHGDPERHHGQNDVGEFHAK